MIPAVILHVLSTAIVIIKESKRRNIHFKASIPMMQNQNVASFLLEVRSHGKSTGSELV
jgi:hypothetical protein